MGHLNVVGEYLTTLVGLATVTTTAGGSGDATDQNGATIDRAAYNMPQSAVIDVTLITNLTTAKQVTVTVRLQDSADGSTWADFQNTNGGYNYTTVPTHAGLQTLIVLAANKGTNHVQGWYNLAGAKRYVRIVVKATHTAANTDTTIITATAILAGMQELPSTQPANA